jgi:hypothetical protein
MVCVALPYTGEQLCCILAFRFVDHHYESYTDKGRSASIENTFVGPTFRTFADITNWSSQHGQINTNLYETASRSLFNQPTHTTKQKHCTAGATHTAVLLKLRRQTASPILIDYKGVMTHKLRKK